MFYQGKLYLFCSYKERAKWCNQLPELWLIPPFPSPDHIRAVSRTAARMIHAEQNKQYLGFTGETVKRGLLNFRSNTRRIMFASIANQLQSKAQAKETLRILKGGSINTMADQLQVALKRS
jgi:hypothetical protein